MPAEDAEGAPPGRPPAFPAGETPGGGRRAAAGVVPLRHAAWHGRAGVAAVLAITALGAGLRLWNLGRESLWLDEAFSVALVRQPWPAFWHDLATREANMALHHVLLRLWTSVAGDSEVAVRSLSLVFGVATIPVLYAVGSRLLGHRLGLLAAFLLSIHGSHIRYSQEARGYSLAVLLVTLSTVLFVRAVRRPSRGAWAGYAAVAALAVYAHFFAALALAAQWTSLAFLTPRSVPWRSLLASGVAVAAVALPLAAFVARGDAGQISWVPPPGPVEIAKVLWWLAGTAGEVAAYTALSALALNAGWRDLRAHGRSVHVWRTALPACWLLVPLLLALAVSLLKPLLVPRYLLVSSPAFVLLAAAGLARLEPARRRGLSLVATVCLALAGIGVYHRMYMKEDWRGAARLALSDGRSGDAAVIYPPYLRRPYDYYRRRFGQPEGGPEIVFPPADYSRDEPDPSVVAGLAEHHPRVWVVSSHVGETGRARDVLEHVVLERLAERYSRSRTIRFQEVTIVLFWNDDSGSGRPAAAPRPLRFALADGRAREGPSSVSRSLPRGGARARTLRRRRVAPLAFPAAGPGRSLALATLRPTRSARIVPRKVCARAAKGGRR